MYSHKPLARLAALALAAALCALPGCFGTGQAEPSAPQAQQSLLPEPEQPAPDILADCTLTKGQVHALTFGAATSWQIGLDYNTLTGSANAGKAAALLEEYGIADHATAIEKLDWLLYYGHRRSDDPEYAGYDEILALLGGSGEAARAFDAELAACRSVLDALERDYGYTGQELAAICSTSAWDYDRLVALARLCSGRGLISQDEAWGRIARAGLAGADQVSWRVYFAGVLLGRAIHSAAPFSDGDRALADALLKDPGSIYRAVPFDYRPDGA